MSIPLVVVNEVGHYFNMESLYPQQFNLALQHQTDYQRMFKVLKKSTTLSDVYSTIFRPETAAHTAEDIRLHEQAVRHLLYHTIVEGNN